MIIKDITNKVVCITGSSRGIGKETAVAFAKEGCRIIITYNSDESGAREAEKLCKASGSPEVLTLQLDITRDESIAQAVLEIKNHFGMIDILVNNAAVVVWKKFAEQTLDEIILQLRTNLEGTISMTHHALPIVKETIINIASSAGQHGMEKLAPYCATKFGIRGFSESLSTELSNINVYIVNPGLTATQMTGYAGTPPDKVAEVIVNTAKGMYNLESGWEVNVWDVLSPSS